MKKVGTAIALAAMSVCPCVSHGQDFREQFLAEYAAAATAVRDAFTNVECRMAVTWFAADGLPWQMDESQVKYNFRNHSIHLVKARVRRKADNVWVDRKQVVEAANPRYEFTLADYGDPEHRTLSRCQPAMAGVKPNLITLCVPYANQQPAGRSYFDIARDPATRVLKYATETQRGKPVKRLTVEMTTLHPTTRKPLRLRLAFDFDPDTWVCLSHSNYSEDGQNKLVVEEIYEYEPRPGELPVLKSIEQRFFNEVPTGRLHRRTEITDFRRSKTPFPDSDFTLTAFSFPEPEGLPDPPKDQPPIWSVEADALSVPDPGTARPWYVWPLAGVAVLVLLAAVVAVVRRIRRRVSTPGATP